MIKKINIEKCIFLSIMFLLIAFPIIMIYRYTFLSIGLNKFPQINRAHLLWYVTIFLGVFYLFDLIFNKKKITYIDILIYLLIILGIISTIYAVDVHTSLYGEFGRNEGLFSLLSYYFIFLNLKNMTNEKYKKILIKTIIILGIFSLIYGILQVYTNLTFIMHYSKDPYMASGLSGNPNFFGSYMVILSSYVFSMYMLKREKKYLILSIVFFIGICLASSTGPFLSFALMIVFFIIYYHKRIKWIDFFKIVSLFVVFYFLVDFSVKYVHTNIFQNELNPQYNISADLKNLNLSSSGNGRLRIWKDSLDILKKNWVIGVGIDNFGRVYGIWENVYYDKAHNVYLQIAVTNGIFALIVYMTILLIIFLKSLKLKEAMYVSLFMSFIGYSIQAFTNISVIEVAPTFYVVCGLLFGRSLNSHTSDLVANEAINIKR